MQLKSLKASIQTDYPELPSHWLQDWLLHIIDRPSSFLITDGDYHLSESEQERWVNGIKKMQSGIPLAYLLGKQAFWSLDFMVNEHTLIPRPDTEVLIEQVLVWIESNAKTLNSNQEDTTNRLLDLGTGSGCIAISLGYALEQQQNRLGEWLVTAVDNSQQALNIAKQNIELNQVSNVQLKHSSWFDGLTDILLDNKKFSVIVSNPPYIDTQDHHLQQLIAEPITALVADNQGLADIEHIVEQAPKHLLLGGLLIIEHGYQQAEAVQNIFYEYGFVNVTTVKDYGGNDRATMGTLKI